MDKYKGITDSLSEEIVSQVAENFFSGRVELDEMIDIYERSCDNLSVTFNKVLLAYKMLEKICLGKKGVGVLFTFLGLEINFDQLNVEDVKSCYSFDVPFAFTLKGKYIRLLELVYEKFQVAVTHYMYGENVKNSDGRYIRSVSYNDLTKFVEEINNKVESHSQTGTTQVLQLVSSFTDGTTKKRFMAGCTTDECQQVDASLEFKKISINSNIFPRLDDLPEVKFVSPVLKIFAKKFYSEHEEDLRKLLNEK